MIRSAVLTKIHLDPKQPREVSQSLRDQVSGSYRNVQYAYTVKCGRNPFVIRSAVLTAGKRSRENKGRESQSLRDQVSGSYNIVSARNDTKALKVAIPS